MFVRANLLRKVKHLDLAMAAYKEVLKLKPDFIEAILNIGLLHADNGSLEESMTYFDRALSIRPDMYECYVNKGALFERMGKFEDAYQCFKKALSINPIAKDALLNAGIVSEKLGKLQESLDCYDRLLELDPKNLGAYSNRGYVNERLQRLDSSISDYNKAIELAPDHWDAYWNRALAILCKGDFEKGWLEYENRFKLKMAANFYSRDEVKNSLWNGDTQLIRQKVLLVRSEQGLGDTIQFCRYVKQLSNMGAKVILQVQGPLINLLNELDGVSKVIHES
jgi:tetratricopeptide (TPR) repeat protein